MKTFFTSDTHFGHVKAIEHGRPFATIEEMAEVTVENWNRVVSDNDLVIHFGDVAMGQRAEVLARYMPQLKGKKTLLFGNHDYVGHIHKHKNPDKMEYWRGIYRSFFHEMTTELVGLVAGVRCQMAHLPFVGDHEGTEPRFLKERPLNLGVPLLHGHVHDTWLVRKEEGYPLQLNVGVDMWNFTPVSEEELEPWLK